MKDERIIENMARLEGLEIAFDTVCMISRDVQGEPMPIPVPFSTDYLNDHNACQRVIDGMYDSRLSHYMLALSKVCGGYHHSVKATPRQKCKAILKVYGKWEES